MILIIIHLLHERLIKNKETINALISGLNVGNTNYTSDLLDVVSEIYSKNFILNAIFEKLEQRNLECSMVGFLECLDVFYISILEGTAEYTEGESENILFKIQEIASFYID